MGNVTEDATEEAARGPARSTRLLFRNRDYTGWWIGDTVSDFGSALSLVGRVDHHVRIDLDVDEVDAEVRLAERPGSGVTATPG